MIIIILMMIMIIIKKTQKLISFLIMTNVTEKLNQICFMRIRYLLFLINNNHRHHRHHYDRHKDNVAINLSQKSFVSFLLASGSGGYQYDSKAFLFSLVNKPGWAPVKLSQSGQSSSSKNSILFSPTLGPTFGAGNDIYISNYASSNSISHSNLGYTYSPPSGYSYTSTFAKTFLAGTYTFTPDEVETFYETT